MVMYGWMGQTGQNNHFLRCKFCPDGNVWMDGTDRTEQLFSKL